MHTTMLETIHIETLIQVGGGDSGGFWQDMQHLGKATVNGGVNTLNFLHDHPIELGKLGTFSIGGNRIEKPFNNDPLSEMGKRKVTGTPHPAKR